MKKHLFTISFLIVSLTFFGQSAKVLEGDAKNLKGIKKFNVKFDYSNLMIKKETEAEYLKKAAEKMEAKGKGKGEEYKKNWLEHQKTKYPYKFVQSFNKRFKEKQCEVEYNNDSILHTILVETKKMNLGYLLDGKTAKVDFILSVLDEEDNILVSISYKSVLGNGPGRFNKIEWIKLEEAHAKLAKEFAHYMIRKLK